MQPLEQENERTPEAESPELSGQSGASAQADPVADVPVSKEHEALSRVIAEAEQLRVQTGELRDQLLRAVAETENVRRRAQRDQGETSKYAISGFARDLVSAIDNLYRAADTLDEQTRKSNERFDRYAEGIEMTLREVASVCERFGVKRIWPLGEMFDHNLHQAVVQIDDAEHPAGTVLQVMQAGYVIHDRLLRPAMVAVAKTPQAPADTHALDTEA